MLPRELIDDILANANIVDVISSYLSVTKKGRNYAAVCPFHDDKNPSLMISKDKQIYKCFVCQEGGNAITFVQRYENIKFEDAVRKVAELISFNDPRLQEGTKATHVDESKTPLYKALTELADFYSMSLRANEGRAGLEYLQNRHLSEDVIKKFGIGFCPNNSLLSINYMQATGHSLKTLEIIGIAGHNGTNYVDRNFARVIFPIRDANGQVVGFSARSIIKSDEAKYINSPETPVFHKGNILYNYDLTKKSARLDGYVYVVEGFMDVIALHRSGINSCVALMGTAMTHQHIEALRRLNVEVRMCLDGDAAGQMATMKIIQMLDQSGIKYRIVRRSEGNKDVDEMLEKHGTDQVKAYIGQLVDKAQFAYDYFRLTNPMKTVEERKRFVMDFIPLLLGVTSTLEIEDYLLNIARISEFPINSIREILTKAQTRHTESSEKKTLFPDFHLERRVLSRLQLTEKGLLYQMLTDQKAIEYFKKEEVPLSDEIYRKIADYIVECQSSHESFTIGDLINDIENSLESNKQLLISEVTNISMEKHHPTCSEPLLSEYREIMNQERSKKYDEFRRRESLKGKTPEEKIKILTELNRSKNEKLNAKSIKKE